MSELYSFLFTDSALEHVKDLLAHDLEANDGTLFTHILKVGCL